MREPGSIEQRIRDEATAALKAGDRRRREALASILAALKKERIDSGRQPTEADEVGVLRRERKRREEALAMYEQAGRDDLADQERYEIALIEAWLPEELGEAELGALVDQALAETGAAGPRDMGKVMAWLKPKVAGRADMRAVSDLVRRRLGG
jgi:uncharacterized protein YqeY